MLSRRNAVVGWLVLRIVKRKLRRAGHQSGPLRTVGKVAGAGLGLVAIGVAAAWFLGRNDGGSGGTGSA
jgi:hypothetical protein